ncbi:methyltransferase domain-containing protein [Niveispirillum sp. SYP-B3756]|uniref:methyltransferase domain-containing protein n=1 Tax=Niveispirillum sp. SYP-B3756 TaxID=2662178 RepID=UPI0012909F93|nr:methyltransferase domain-containing protein [Niveispirillum sp. SYP-B3756]
MPGEFQSRLIASYDAQFSGMAFSPDSRPEDGFRNLGYFTPQTQTHGQACEQLVDQMVGMLAHPRGKLLDVACGLGGTTRCLAKYFAQEQIHGINLSEMQLQDCRGRLPAAHFQQMPAERMTFADATFDVVVCIEAAMHFKGRRAFLSEAFRVLKPGGELLVADMPFHGEPESFTAVLSDQEIYGTVEEYCSLWRACGFTDLTARDVTEPVWRGFVRHSRNKALHHRLSGQLDGDGFAQYLRRIDKIDQLPALAYLLVAARKPGAMS